MLFISFPKKLMAYPQHVRTFLSRSTSRLGSGSELVITKWTVPCSVRKRTFLQQKCNGCQRLFVVPLQMRSVHSSNSMSSDKQQTLKEPREMGDGVGVGETENDEEGLGWKKEKDPDMAVAPKEDKTVPRVQPDSEGLAEMSEVDLRGKTMHRPESETEGLAEISEVDLRGKTVHRPESETEGLSQISESDLPEKTMRRLGSDTEGLTEITEIDHRGNTLLPPSRHLILTEVIDELGPTPAAFAKAVDVFVDKAGPRRLGCIEFANSALGEMRYLGVVRNLEAYKKLLSVFPQGPFLPKSFLHAEFMQFPQHQQCCIDILDFAERHGVIPDEEIKTLVCAIFGTHSHAARKLYRQFYWLPKFAQADPYDVAYSRLTLDPYYNLEEICLRRMCVDPETEITVTQSSDVGQALDDTYIVCAQSPTQRLLLEQHPEDRPIFVEGGFHFWLQTKCMTYFVLRSEVTARCRDAEEKEGAEPVPGESDEEVIPREIYLTEIPESVRKAAKDEARKQPTAHEQTDGTVVAMAMTGSGSKDALKAWVKSLERTNPKLAQIPVVFRLRTPESGVPEWDGHGAYTQEQKNSFYSFKDKDDR